MTGLDNTTPHKSTEYDNSIRKTIPFYETILSEVIDLVRTLKPEVNCWLDTGCGTGYLVKSALSIFPKTKFIQTDPSEAMLTQARMQLNNQSENRVRFLPPMPSQNLVDYVNMVAPQVVTGILCHHYLHEPQRREATRACYELLDDNGIFITVENITPGTESAISRGLERWKRFQLEHGRSKSVVEEHGKRFNTEYFPISVEEHLVLLKETGFKSANLFWLSHMQAGFYALK
jgi:tRNA (cmo5U34)-methyltransferase